MKRLYLVGTTADNKRLVLAKASGAKFGSFVVPITPKLKRILQELEEGRAENVRKGKGKAAEAEAPDDAAAPNGDDNAFEKITGLTGKAAKAAAKRGKAAKAAPAPEPEPEPEPVIERRPPINSRLAPAQIQALLRQGKSAQSVAKAAGAPLDWVRRLMEPILLERVGIVEEMKRATFTKARRGPSNESVGFALVDNLRDRGVAFPERIAATGWTAYRPDGREWRVKFTYAHRGASRTAQWQYDPATRTVVPMNILATQLSWRGTNSEGVESESGNTPRARRQAPKRRPAAKKKAAKKRTAKKRTAEKRTSRKPAAKKRTAKKTTSRKAPAKKRPATRRTASRR